MGRIRDWLFPGPVRVARVTHQGREGYEVRCAKCGTLASGIGWSAAQRLRKEHGGAHPVRGQHVAAGPVPVGADHAITTFSTSPAPLLLLPFAPVPAPVPGVPAAAVAVPAVQALSV